MSVKQLSVFAENRPGAVVEITDVLSAENIDIRAMNIADTQDFGIVRLIVSDIEKGRTALKAAGSVVSVNDVVCVEMPDHPGALGDIMRLLADNGINIEYMYAFLAVSRRHALTVFRVSDNARTEAILAENGVKIADESAISEL